MATASLSSAADALRAEASVTASPPESASPGSPAADLIPLALGRAAAARPDHPALVWQGGITTYRDLAVRADAMARRLAQHQGLAAGERVAVAMGNCPEFVALVHAAHRLGAAVSPLNPELTVRELAAQLGYVRPAVVVTDSASQAHLSAALAEAGQSEVMVITGVDEAAPPLGRPPAFATAGRLRDTALVSDAAAIVFTSGTSARPRGVIVTHGNAAWSAAASALRLGHDPADRWLAVLPLFHMGGLSILLRAAWYATTVVLEGDFDAARASAAMRGDVSLASLVPTMLRRVLEHWPPPTGRGATLAASAGAPTVLRAVLVGGGPLTGALVTEAREKGLPVCPTYGLTEASSQVATQVSWDAGEDPLAAPPMPFTTVRIVRGAVEAAPGEEGDLLVAGPTVMPGYFGRPNATAAVMADGWLRTGDMGSVGRDGRLRVTGRRRDRIVTGGENVTPAEVEGVLESDPAVAEACVVGVPSEEWGMEVAAALVAPPGADPETEGVLARARERLAAYKLPKKVLWVDALPRTASGKVRRGDVGVLLGAPPLPEEPPD